VHKRGEAEKERGNSLRERLLKERLPNSARGGEVSREKLERKKSTERIVRTTRREKKGTTGHELFCKKEKN